MSPKAHVVVHFSSRSFSPYAAPIALLSQATSFSPDAGLRNVGRVVVAAVGNVVEMTDGAMVVLAPASVVFPQETKPTRRGRSKSAFFTEPFCRARTRFGSGTTVDV